MRNFHHTDDFPLHFTFSPNWSIWIKHRLLMIASNFSHLNILMKHTFNFDEFLSKINLFNSIHLDGRMSPTKKLTFHSLVTVNLLFFFFYITNSSVITSTSISNSSAITSTSIVTELGPTQPLLVWTFPCFTTWWS